MPMIKVVITGKSSQHGTFPYIVQGHAVEGRSRQPLLDACRLLGRMGVGPTRPVGLFREGSEVWDLRTSVGVGAKLTVHEEPSTRFMAFHASPFA